VLNHLKLFLKNSSICYLGTSQNYETAQIDPLAVLIMSHKNSILYHLKIVDIDNEIMLDSDC